MKAVRFALFSFLDEQLKPFEKWRSGDELLVYSQSSKAVLPVEWKGQMELFQWGNHESSCPLPQTGFCKIESLELGKWQYLQPKLVEIPVQLGLSRGVWFQVRKAIQGIVVQDPKGKAIVYIVTKKSTHYFKTMTGAERMPVLLEQIL